MVWQSLKSIQIYTENNLVYPFLKAKNSWLQSINNSEALRFMNAVGLRKGEVKCLYKHIPSLPNYHSQYSECGKYYTLDGPTVFSK